MNAFAQRSRRRRYAPETSNPWLETGEPHASTPSPASADQDDTIAELAPQPGVTPPAPGKRLAWLRLSPDEPTAAVYVVSAHGGAGASTIALLGGEGWQAVSQAWPIAPASTARPRVLVCARTSYQGLRAAQAAMTDWTSGRVPVQLAGLALLAAAPGRPPRQLRALLELVRGTAPDRVWEIGWQAQWQLAEPVMPADRTLRDLYHQLTNHPPTEA